MKTKSLFCALFALALFAGCSKSENVDPSDPTISVPDPEGTVVLYMRNANSGKTYLPDVALYIDGADNFVGAPIVSLGKMNGLGNVTYIPKTGWVSKAAVVPGTGYVIEQSQMKFIRLYVSRYTTNIANEIIGAEVKYQQPFTGVAENLSLSASALLFDCEGGEQTVHILNKSYIPCKVEATGCEAYLTCSEGAVLPDCINVRATRNTSAQDSHGTVTLTAADNRTSTIDVTVKGTDPYLTCDPTQLQVDGARTSRSVRISTNVPSEELVVTSSAAWCEAKLSDGYVELSILANDERHERTANITAAVKGNNEVSATIAVIQSPHTFVLSEEPVDFDRQTNDRSIELTTTTDEFSAVSSDTSWCTLSWNGSTITVGATSNDTQKNRTATVTVTLSDGQSKTIKVNQSRYMVGDTYNENNIEGIVYNLTTDFHGRIISKDYAELAWSTENVATGATDKEDGMVNMNVIKAIPNWETLYPAFAWCDAKNKDGITGWYLPACHELQKACGR